ncbi:MAG: hypothetical protein ACRD0Y_11980 [Terriglobales bacterium]
MAVFTAFFCGTGSNSFDFANSDYHCGELVSTLARNAAGMEFVDWIILDGPGSGNHQEDEKFVTPGNYSTARGIAFGSGWEENVAHAVAMIHGKAQWERDAFTESSYQVLKAAGVPIPDAQALDAMGMTHAMPKRPVTQQALQMQKIKIFRKRSPVTQINAIGWSRGAVTTHMFAHALAQDPALRHLPVNLIAVDPVPGTGNFQLSRTSIPTNVVNYVAFYARDERSTGFDATLPSIPSCVHSSIYPLPGRHATLVGNAGNYVGGNGANLFFGPGKVVRMLAEHHLSAWGTRLNQCLPYSEMEMLHCYDEMLAQAAGYAALRGKTYSYSTAPWLRQDPGRNINLGQDWRSSTFDTALHQRGPYINWHHGQLFRQFGGLGNRRWIHTNRAVLAFLSARGR